MVLTDADNDAIKSKIQELEDKISTIDKERSELVLTKSRLAELYQWTVKVEQEDGTDLDVKRDVIDPSTGEVFNETRREMLRDKHIVTADAQLA